MDFILVKMFADVFLVHQFVFLVFLPQARRLTILVYTPTSPPELMSGFIGVVGGVWRFDAR